MLFARAVPRMGGAWLTCWDSRQPGQDRANLMRTYSMALLTKEQRDALLANGHERARSGGGDFWPVVKLFTPDAQCTWLLTDLDPEDKNIAFGLWDFGTGCPELGRISLAEIRTIRGKLGLSAESDPHFRARAPISVYAEKARFADRIVEFWDGASA